jgi:glycosyltransferase involved in cell wall biosynthesis
MQFGQHLDGSHLSPCGLVSARDSCDVSVVVPTRGRVDELRRCLGAISSSETQASYEIIVVDDGSDPPLATADLVLPRGPKIRLLRRQGLGPASARNAGIKAARGTAVLFTDDDTIPLPGWVDGAWDFLVAHPPSVGVAGPTTSPAYDRLYFHSVRSVSPGTFLTCNIAYRRAELEFVGGFAEVFPLAHAEDLDLGIRMIKLGPVGYTDAMAVVHPPRPIRLLAQMRKGHALASDATLFRRHPDVFPKSRWSPRLYTLGLNAKNWGYCAVRDVYGVALNPWRAIRFGALACGYTVIGLYSLVGRRVLTAPHPGSAHLDSGSLG